MTDQKSRKLRDLAALHDEKADAAEALDGEVAVAYHRTRAEELRMQADRLECTAGVDGPQPGQEKNHG